MEDDTIPFELGKKLYEISKSEYEPWWVEGAKHMDIVDLYEEEYFKRLNAFLDYCDEKNQSAHRANAEKTVNNHEKENKQDISFNNTDIPDRNIM